jgi:hypothetical protein
MHGVIIEKIILRAYTGQGRRVIGHSFKFDLAKIVINPTKTGKVIYEHIRCIERILFVKQHW